MTTGQMNALIAGYCFVTGAVFIVCFTCTLIARERMKDNAGPQQRGPYR